LEGIGLFGVDRQLHPSLWAQVPSLPRIRIPSRQIKLDLKWNEEMKKDLNFTQSDM
jgi:hypothetical protein